jgi:hypothetical protein
VNQAEKTALTQSLEPSITPVLLEEAEGANVVPDTIESLNLGGPEMVSGIQEPEATEPEGERMEERLKQSGDQIDDQADSQFEADVAQAEVVEEITRPAPPVDDGISDLFSVTDDDIGAGEDLDDLTDVDFERDILDADDDGSIESLVSVDTQRDIMGVEPKRKVRKVRIVRPTYRPPPTGGMGTLRY